MVSRDDEARAREPYILVMQLLRSLRERVRSLGPKRFDALISAAFLIEAELEVLLLMDGARYAWIAAVMQAGLATALAIRRTAPFASLLLTLVSFIGFQPLG